MKKPNIFKLSLNIKYYIKINFNLAPFYLVEVEMRLSLAVSLLAVFTGHMTEAKGGRGKKGNVQNKLQ